MTSIIKQTNGVEKREWPANNSGVPQVALTTTLSDTTDSVSVYPKCSYTNLSASALIKTGAGQLYGIIINSYTPTATIKVWDSTTGSGTVLLNTITITATDRFIPLMGMTFGTGCFVTIAVAAADITVAYR